LNKTTLVPLFYIKILSLLERQKDRKAERQKGRKMERQKDRKTEG